MRKITLLVSILLAFVLLPSMAVSKLYKSEQLLTATDLVNTSQMSRWVVSPGFEGLWCTLDVTAISGADATVHMQIVGCMPAEIVAEGCVDYSDSKTFYQSLSLTTVAETSMGIFRNVVSGIGTTTFLKDAWGQLPPLWAMRIEETGATTVSYTVDCVWW